MTYIDRYVYMYYLKHRHSSMKMNDLKQTACLAIDDVAKELHNLSTEIWSNPELNYEEHYAHKILTDFLEKKGFNVTRNYVVDTAFKAELGSVDNGPNIAVMCEYDALPEIGHACGHNLIAEAGVAAGIGVQAAFKAAGKPVGKITILGTPAEEEEGGKIDLINAGAFDGIDAAMMVHPAPHTFSHVTMAAIDTVTVKYTGKSAHAAAFPWEGVNALDAAVLCYQTVSCLRQQMKPEWRVHGIIKHGGVKPNIIPDYAELLYYFRAPCKKELDQLREKMRSCFESAATGTGCQVECEFSGRPCLDVVTNKRMADVFRINAEYLGVKFDTDNDFSGASTDMGNVSYTVPSIHPIYAIQTKGGNHTKEFTKASGDAKAQAPTLAQGKAMALTCIDLFQKSDFLMDVKNEFSIFMQTLE